MAAFLGFDLEGWEMDKLICLLAQVVATAAWIGWGLALERGAEWVGVWIGLFALAMQFIACAGYYCVGQIDTEDEYEGERR